MNEIITERIQIVPLELKYDSFILELLNSHGWKEFIGDRNINTLEEAQVYIQNIIEKKDADYGIVIESESASPVGVISFLKRDYLDHKDLGFAFLPQFSGRGYAFESAELMLNLLKKDHPVILATVLPHNLRSINLLKKLRFIETKTLIQNDQPLLLFTFNSSN